MVNGCRTTKIYCRENCPPGRRTKPENRVHFASREEARAAGYRACLVCKPDESLEPWQPKNRATQKEPSVVLAYITADEWTRVQPRVSTRGGGFPSRTEELDAGQLDKGAR